MRNARSGESSTRLPPGGRAATLTLAELVAEYLEVHQAAPATIEKLRWLLAKATDVLGNVRLVELRSEAICAWQGTLPEGHRFEARRRSGRCSTAPWPGS